MLFVSFIEDEDDVDVEEGEVGLEALMSEKDKDSVDETTRDSKVCTLIYIIVGLEKV